MSPGAGRFLGRDPIGYEDTDLLYEYVNAAVANALDPTGLATIECTCACRYGRFSIVTAETECDGLADECCARACQNRGEKCFYEGGGWRNIDSEFDDVLDYSDCYDKIVDNAESATDVCLIALDVFTVPSGEGPALCLAKKPAVRYIKSCYRTCKKWKRRKMRSCFCFDAGTWREPDWTSMFKAGKTPCRGQNGNTTCNNYCKARSHKFGLCLWP